MRRLICSIIAVMLFVLTGSARANTIMAVLQSVTPTGGNFVYDYQIQVTNLNGLSGANDGFESGLILVDFNGLIGTPTLAVEGSDVTSTGDWQANVAMTGGVAGGSILSNTSYNGALTFINGNAPPNLAAAPDSASVANIELKYQGSALAPNPLLPQMLIHLQVTSKIGLVLLQSSLSRDVGGALVFDPNSRPTENFSYLAPNNGGGPFLPLPSTAGVGLVLLGGLGFGRVRRLNLV